jgi:hypothetical protein
MMDNANLVMNLIFERNFLLLFTKGEGVLIFHTFFFMSLVYIQKVCVSIFVIHRCIFC